jgi:hypothetical protein
MRSAAVEGAAKRICVNTVKPLTDRHADRTQKRAAWQKQI